MKLQNIINQFGLRPRTGANNTTIVDAPIGTDYRRHLFDLVDYVVTGCAGDMVWLSPRHWRGGVPYGN